MKQILIQLLKERYPKAQTAFWSGSSSKNEHTQTSDLDLVVIFEHVPNAYREAFIYEGWPIDAFVHDPETIAYFFEHIDKSSKILALPNMVFEGIEIPLKTELGTKLQALALSIIKSSPIVEPNEFYRRRFHITDLLDDIRIPKSQFEKMIIMSELCKQLMEFYLLSNKQWIGSGKQLSRLLNTYNPSIFERFVSSFNNSDETQKIFDLAEEILNPHGGLLWAGFHLDAPKKWRISSET